MSTEALRGTSRHQFLCRRNELSARLEMDGRKEQNGYGRRLRHQTRCDPSGSNLYRRSHRLGSVNHCGAGRTRGAPTLTTLAVSDKPVVAGAFFRPPLATSASGTNLRHADRLSGCPFVGGRPEVAGPRSKDVCEPTGRANARPMTSSAKQSSICILKRGLLRCVAPCNDVGSIWRHTLGTRSEACCGAAEQYPLFRPKPNAHATKIGPALPKCLRAKAGV
jgi:hypothetical protein